MGSTSISPANMAVGQKPGTAAEHSMNDQTSLRWDVHLYSSFWMVGNFLTHIRVFLKIGTPQGIYYK